LGSAGWQDYDKNPILSNIRYNIKEIANIKDTTKLHEFEHVA